MKRMKPNTYLCYKADGSVVYADTRTQLVRKRWWTKARVPGTVRSTRMPGGSGYRGDKLWEGG